jgi:voltage-gated potassium channel Kch
MSPFRQSQLDARRCSFFLIGHLRRRKRGETVKTAGDALWWAIVTVTTVGYGDVSPATAEGRLIAVALMLIGIGVISALTATIASFFVEDSCCS